jgi:hypothetical protein
MYPGRRAGTLVGMTTVALLDRPFGRAVLREVTLRERVVAWLHGDALDHAVAAGAPAESSVALTLHARRLIAPRTRRRIAKTLHGIVETTYRRPAPPARPAGLQVRRAVPELVALAERLERNDAVDARGVALARELLRDGRGPLYADCGGRRLAEAALAATAALDPE